MANVGFFKLGNTGGEYVKLATLTELTFTADTKYLFQVFNSDAQMTVCISSTKPTEGGFFMKSGEKFAITAQSGVDIYVLISGPGKCHLNIAS